MLQCLRARSSQFGHPTPQCPHLSAPTPPASWPGPPTNTQDRYKGRTAREIVVCDPQRQPTPASHPSRPPPLPIYPRLLSRIFNTTQTPPRPRTTGAGAADRPPPPSFLPRCLSRIFNTTRTPPRPRTTGAGAAEHEKSCSVAPLCCIPHWP
ncbi:hypothetical protein C8Q74DRAFT_1370331 [Fomes fomentarius]|nr:hypothetical protein C8Q74DRAFT_1370331 [Fomes fomentarius]